MQPDTKPQPNAKPQPWATMPVYLQSAERPIQIMPLNSQAGSYRCYVDKTDGKIIKWEYIAPESPPIREPTTSTPDYVPLQMNSEQNIVHKNVYIRKQEERIKERLSSRDRRQSAERKSSPCRRQVRAEGDDTGGVQVGHSPRGGTDRRQPSLERSSIRRERNQSNNRYYPKASSNFWRESVILCNVSTAIKNWRTLEERMRHNLHNLQDKVAYCTEGRALSLDMLHKVDIQYLQRPSLDRIAYELGIKDPSKFTYEKTCMFIRENSCNYCGYISHKTSNCKFK